MTFKEALQILDIEDYAERICNSNSHGELFHLSDYISLAKMCEHVPQPNGFREVFEQVVSDAERLWERPSSVYQHILRIFQESLMNHS